MCAFSHSLSLLYSFLFCDISQVSSGLVTSMLCSYTIVTLGIRMKELRSRMGLIWFGAATQIGAFVGSSLMFILINVVEVFTAKAWC